MLALKLPKALLFGYFLLFVFILASDQLYKHNIRQAGGFYVCNGGISFGIAFPFLLFWLILLALGLITFLYVGFRRAFPWNSSVAIGLILFFGGALSNLLDRCLHGCVTDFIALFQPRLPVFNLADCFIFSGALLIFFNLLSKDCPKSV